MNEWFFKVYLTGKEWIWSPNKYLTPNSEFFYAKQPLGEAQEDRRTFAGNLGEQQQHTSERGKDYTWVEPSGPHPSWGELGRDGEFCFTPRTWAWKMKSAIRQGYLPSTLWEKEPDGAAFTSFRKNLFSSCFNSRLLLREHKCKQRAIKRVPLHQEKTSRKENKWPNV